MKKNWSERLETGDVVKNDQTVTIRVAKSKQKVRGKLKTQCPGGCGTYLDEDGQQTHFCPWEIRTQWRRHKWPRRLYNIAKHFWTNPRFQADFHAAKTKNALDEFINGLTKYRYPSH